MGIKSRQATVRYRWEVREIVLKTKVHSRLYRLKRRRMRRRIGYCSPVYERYIIFALLQYVWDDQIKQDQRGEACSMHAGR